MNESPLAVADSLGNFIYGDATIVDVGAQERSFRRSRKIAIEIDWQLVGFVGDDLTVGVFNINIGDTVCRSVFGNLAGKLTIASRSRLARREPKPAFTA